ncbi:hypothetical protein, partial [Roseococcus suduntuyensis]|uniref:hypothetical protein n=1 Tax=Roseococcus suduntuyensis TaxID=455361 RepID=UPI001C85A7C6
WVARGDGTGRFGALQKASDAFGWAHGWGSQDEVPRLLADLNGDGIADVIAFQRAGTLSNLSLGWDGIA